MYSPDFSEVKGREGLILCRLQNPVWSYLSCLVLNVGSNLDSVLMCVCVVSRVAFSMSFFQFAHTVFDLPWKLP